MTFWLGELVTFSRAHLEQLATDAAAHGFALIARKASVAANAPAH